MDAGAVEVRLLPLVLLALQAGGPVSPDPPRGLTLRAPGLGRGPGAGHGAALEAQALCRSSSLHLQPDTPRAQPNAPPSPEAMLHVPPQRLPRPCSHLANSYRSLRDTSPDLPQQNLLQSLCARSGLCHLPVPSCLPVRCPHPCQTELLEQGHGLSRRRTAGLAQPVPTEPLRPAPRRAPPAAQLPPGQLTQALSAASAQDGAMASMSALQQGWARQGNQVP